VQVAEHGTVFVFQRLLKVERGARGGATLGRHHHHDDTQNNQ